MVAELLALLAAVIPPSAVPPVQQQDTLPTFATPAVRALVLRGIGRHRQQDSAVVDYQARIRYRLTASVGRRRWGRIPVGSVEEQEGTIAWHLPNDLRVDIVGRRALTRDGIPKMSSVFDRPWFVPRSVGDSVRIFSDEFPATGALHPLAGDAPLWYRYALTDSLMATIPGGRRIRLYAVEFTPARPGPALVVGRLWLDAGTAEIVRFTFRYVGTELWAHPEDETGHDSTTSRRLNAIANNIITIDADLEYGLEEDRFWMPFRQTIAGKVKVPLVDVVVPFEATTTFSDYTINAGREVAFTLPAPDTTLNDSVRALRRERHDSVRAAREHERRDDDSTRGWERAGRWNGGRYEVHRPSNDSLSKFSGWTDSLAFEAQPADDRRIRGVLSDLAGLAEALPDDVTLRKPMGFGYERIGDAFGYNRVQGYSLGAGYRLRVPGASFSNLFATARYGFSDERVTGRLSFVRDAPSGRFSLHAYRDVLDADPFSPGRNFANSVDAIFAGHDDADYYLGTGAGAAFERSLNTGLDLTVTARAERQRSVDRRAHSGVNDFLGGTGVFPPNAPIAEGDYGDVGLRLDGYGSTRWTLAGEGMAGQGHVAGRVMGQAQRSFGGVRGATLRLKAGYAADPTPQFAFRLGGLNTVRGFEYGFSGGPAFWAAQLDVSLLKANIRPILFLDAGQAGRARDVFSSKALAGGGIGVSIYSPLLRSTLFRIDLSHPITPDPGGRWRFDIVLQAPR